MKKHDFEGVGMTSKRTRERLCSELRQQGIHNEDVLNAIVDTPRHIFIDEAMSHRAYENLPLPIGFGQTISQPYIVAKMTEALLGNKKTLGKVLEIGTGSGYQASILASLCDNVYTVERIKDLLDLAKQKFYKLGLRNIYTKYDDGTTGWRDHAPYDGIIVTCAASEVPEELLEQLSDGANLIIPVESGSGTQQLQIVTKINNDYNTTYLDLVRFVPLLSGKE